MRALFPRFLADYKFPTDGFPLAVAGIRITELAKRTPLVLLAWEEGGLGPAVGTMCQSESGLVFFLRELRHAVEHIPGSGLEIHVDAGELAARGVEPLLADVLNSLGLSRSDVIWRQEESIRDEAARLAGLAVEYRRNRGSSEGEP